MSLRGSLGTMPAPDLFEWLGRRGAAGSLLLERGSTARRFQVESGRVTSASSSDPAEYLGQLLINAGLLDEDTLNRAFREQTQSGKLLGMILVEQGVVHEDAVREMLDLKIRESLYDALSWEDGVFHFEPDPGTSRAGQYEVRVDIGGCLPEGARRAERWRAIRRLVPSEEMRFYVPDLTWVERAKPGSASAQLLADALRGRTVKQMILERHSMPYPVLNRIAELLERGILAPDRRSKVRERPDSELTAEQLVEVARQRAQGGDRRGALEIARRAVEAAPTDDAIRKACRDMERSLLAELSRSLLKKFRIPRLVKSSQELEELPLTPEERYLVGRIDGRWDLLSLMRVAPMRELDALLTFQKLAEAGVITLG